MELLVAHCRACACFFLESPIIVAADNVLCECGGIARILLGAHFDAKDETLFDSVVSSLSAAGVSWMTAPRLARALDNRYERPAGEALVELARLAPSLAVLELIARSDATVARKAESMLATLLEALSALRSNSGFFSRMDLEGARSSRK